MRGNRNSMNVVSSVYGGWVVRKFGSSRAMRRFNTQAQAIDWGKAESKKRGVDLVIHRDNGMIQEWISRGKDDSSLPDPQPTSA